MMLSTSRRASVWVGLSLASVLGIFACSKSDPTEPPPPDRLTIKQVVESTGWFPEVVADSNAWALARFDSTGGGGEPFACTDFAGIETRGLPELTMLVPEADLQYPGAILQWASLFGTTPLAVLADRAGGTLELTTPAGQEITGQVAAVGPAEVTAWRLDALDQLGPAAAGPWDLAAGIVYNADHLSVAAGLGPEAMTADAWQRLAFDEDKRGHSLLRLRRIHHSLACPYPGTASAPFAPDVEGEDIQDQMAEGNPPVWMARVDHGQLLLVLVEADAESEAVLAAAVASFAAAAEDRDLEAGATPVHDLPGVAFSVVAVGADAEAAEAACMAGQQPLNDFLQADVGDPAELPTVTAKLEALRNGGPLTRGVTADFALVTCAVFVPVFDEVLWAFTAADARTSRVDGDLRTVGNGRYRYNGGTRIYSERLVDYVPDLVGDGGAALPLGRRPFFLQDVVNGRPAIEFFEFSLPDGVLYSELRFAGSGIVGREYTIFIVCGMPALIRVTYAAPSGDEVLNSVNQTNYFLHGTGSGGLQNLEVGYPEPGVMKYSHVSELLEFDHRLDAGWHVYALRFGLTTGMAVFYDGELLDEDQFDNRLLQAFSGATLCAGWPREENPSSLSAFWLAEIAAYAGSGTGQMILDETARLQQKYGIAP